MIRPDRDLWAFIACYLCCAKLAAEQRARRVAWAKDSVMQMAVGADGPAGDPVLWLCLIRSRRVGPVTFHRLVAEHGGVEAALAALPGIAQGAGVDRYATCPIEVVRHELALGRVAGAKLLLWGQAGYPAALMELSDAPPVLWAQGDICLLYTSRCV